VRARLLCFVDADVSNLVSATIACVGVRLGCCSLYIYIYIKKERERERERERELARTIYIRFIYGIFGREVTKYTVLYGIPFVYDHFGN